MTSLGLLALQALGIIAFILSFFALRRFFGLAPLYVCLGVFQVLQTLTATVVMKVGTGLWFSPGSSVLFTATLCTVLLVYLREGLQETRKLIYALVLANGASALLMISVGYELRSGSAESLIGMDHSVLSQNGKILLLGTALMLIDVLLIPILYELTAPFLRILPLKMMTTMTLVLTVDSLVFVSVVFHGEPGLGGILRSSILGKVVFGAVYCLMFSLYLWWFERQSVDDRPGQEVRDVVAFLTYRERYEKLQSIAIRDGLTSLYNRDYFYETLGQEWQRGWRTGAPLSLVLADVDHFKALNDRYGHLEGDRALQLVASALKGCSKRPVDCVARYGGEEFAVLLPATPELGAELMAEAMRQAVADLSLRHEASPLGVVTISMGVATVVSDGQQAPEVLIERADRALYQAKNEGRNRIAVFRDSTGSIEIDSKVLSDE